MNWDVVFITLGSVTLATGGVLALFGPIFVEEWVECKNRVNAYKMGAVVIPTLIIAGALLLGLGVPT